MNRRWILGALLAVAVCAPPAHAEVRTYFGFTIGVHGGSPPPAFVFTDEPHVVYVNQVAVVDDRRCDDDVFSCQGAWWRYHDGWWYRSRRWRGPWEGVDVRYVPRRVIDVPGERWRHHPHGGPPGQMKKWDDGDDRGHGHGRGHAYGHDKDHDHGDDDH